MTKLDLDTLKKKIAGFPRKELIHLPTPLRRLDSLTAALGGPEIWVKRDDLTGLAFGGNKSRKLEFIMADALNKGCDAIITWAGVQSNWCLQTAAAARRFGLQPVLVLFQTSELAPEVDGNLLLDRILGADVRIQQAEKGKVVSLEAAEKILNQVTDEVRGQGHKPYVVSVGGSMPAMSMDKPLGAISYVLAFAELEEQARSQSVDITHIVHATGSGGTQAGLVVGAKAAGEGVRVIGISVSDEKESFARIVRTIAAGTETALGLAPSIGEEDVIVLDEYLKEGYGIVNREVAEAIRIVFSREGIVLDPVYTGKAMAALVDLIRKGYFKKDDRVVFFHTGGTPALFPSRRTLLNFLKSI
jgi:D-cysteine desulfhydrase family pyridoxal phosphate-dependent enzyme